MILELDCGNSFIKWRLLCGAQNVAAQGVSGGVEEILAGLEASSVQVSRCRLVSVRSELETEEIATSLFNALGIEVIQARSTERLAGVTNAYPDSSRLGQDRWLAIVGAYSLCHSACVIVDVGTAVTVDIVESSGRHLGGYIAPGMSLLRGQLLSHTRRIRYQAEEQSLATKDLGPGTTTAEAVERGCMLMLRGYVAGQLARAKDCIGENYVTYVTGGDAVLVADLPNVLIVPDLVFEGLAIACP